MTSETNTGTPGSGDEVLNGDELINEFTKETTEKNPNTTSAPPAKENKGDFAPEEEKASESNDAPENSERKIFVADSTASSLVVDTFDFIQSMTFNAINLKKKRARLGENEELAEELYNDVYVDRIKKLDALTPDEKKYVRIYRELKQVEDRIQMTAGEAAELKKNLADIFKDVGYKMSPTHAGLLSIGRIMAVRLSDAIGS